MRGVTRPVSFTMLLLAAALAAGDARSFPALPPGSRVVSLDQLASHGAVLEPGMQVCLLSYSGSGPIVVSKEIDTPGVGIGGGADAALVDAGEWIRFDVSYYATPPLGGDEISRHATYEVTLATDADADGTFGEHLLQAFAADGSSLGVAAVSGLGVHELDTHFGAVPIDVFEINALQDGVRIRNVSYVPAPTRMDQPEYVQLGLTNGSAAAIAPCGAQITGSSLLWMTTATGAPFPGLKGHLGVAGGASDLDVNAGEWVRVQFAEPMQDVSYKTADITDADLDGRFSEHFIEAFDAQGGSLGVVASENFIVLVSHAFADVPIQRFDILGGQDPIGIHDLVWKPVPEAGAGLLQSMAVLTVTGLRIAARRRATRAGPC